MAGLDKDKRVVFRSGKQSHFLEQVQQVTGLTWNELGNKVGVCGRTLRDWKREKFLMSFYVLRELCRIASIAIPKDIVTKDLFWYTKYGGPEGGLAVYKKYGRIGGDPDYRKKKWREWWEREGKFKPHPIINVCLPFCKPNPSTNLAEFFGIMLGDGGMSRQQVYITLHKRDDYEFSKYVRKLVQRLFGISPSVYNYKVGTAKENVLGIVVSRSGLVFWLHGKGLKIGNKIKQQCDIPDWIKKNNTYSIACVRGLVDTDGSFFKHTYKVNGKEYSYKKIGFCSASPPLCKSVCDILCKQGMSPYFHGRRIRLESRHDVDLYVKIFGSRNPKHLKKI